MKIYQFKMDVNNFNILLMKGESGYRIIREFNGSSKAKEWKPIEFEFFKDKKIFGGDVYSFNGIPVFDTTKLSHLKEMLLKYGELLPCRCENKTLYLYNVTTVIDALDLEKSEVRRLKNRDIIMEIKKPVFKTELLIGVDIFKITQANLFTIYVSENFVRIANENDIKGFWFKDFT